MAVLYRVNAQSALFEEALTRAGIPFRVRGGERFLDRPEVQVALDDAAHHGARGTAAAVRRAPHRPRRPTPTSLAEERREHVDALVRLGHEYLEADGGRGTVDGFLEFLQTSLRGDDAGGAGGNAVELLTFHRAKGLEFDTVFVTGLERGLVPISHAKSAGGDGRGAAAALRRAQPGRARAAPHAGRASARSAVARRVARAAAGSTRVEDAVHPPSADASARTAARARHHRRPRATRWRARKGGSTRTKNPTDVADADAPLYEALVDWRLRQSRAASAPAYVIFPNTTLAAIATARPRTTTALLDVPGVGPVKADRYGEAVLALVAEHAQ